MKPWDIKGNFDGRGSSDAFTMPLWEKFDPTDFYFALRVESDVNMTIACFVPAEYFDLSGKMFYDSMPITKHIPPYLEEILPGMYEADIPIHEVRRVLLDRGFTYNHFFQKVVDKQEGNKLFAYDLL